MREIFLSLITVFSLKNAMIMIQFSSLKKFTVFYSKS